MSMDNGIYVLLTETEGGPQYRVAYATAIDNIYGEWNADRAKYVGDLNAIVSTFSESEVFYTLNEALDKAEEIENDIGYTEDGICVISDFKDYSHIFN
ncbi:hypothetical protein EB001_10050 [bacterium]|jgi:hypothetical protein|nr:hypothetical protein [bacterium]